MADEDARFEELLATFRKEHERRTRSLEAHMLKAVAILESETNGLQQTKNVKHAPITYRLKDAEKALRTLRRRQEDRKQLRDLKNLVEARGSKWDEYCKEWSMTDKVDEAELFANTEQMFAAMHDLAGIRISVYFPSDVQKVVEFLRGEHFIVVEEPSRKGGLSRDFQKVRKLVERQRRIHAASDEGKRKDIERMEEAGSAPELTFAGYKATHVVVRLKSLNFDKHARGDSITNIEIQIGSIVMHAWSDIEHDILYKPSGNDKTSADVVRMLDLINGIVMTGEVALQQLASVAAAEATRQAASRTKLADNWHQVVPWFYTYFKERKIEMAADLSWLGPRYLFDVLKSTNDHNYGRVEALLNSMKPKPQPLPHLPFKLLDRLGADAFDKLSFEPEEYSTIWSARYWATNLVNMVSLGLYLDASFFALMWRHWEKKENNPEKINRPTMAMLLDLLHPTNPSARLNECRDIITFCKTSLDTVFKDSSAPTAVRLAKAGYIVRPPLSKEEEKDLPDPPPVFVPAKLAELAYDHVATFHIALGLAGDGMAYDKFSFFIPRKDGGNTWKPVRYERGKRWVVTKKHPFTNDPALKFNPYPQPQSRDITDHTCRVLGMKNSPDEVRTLRKVLLDMPEWRKVSVEELRGLHTVVTTLGTKNVAETAQFVKSTADKGRDEVIELASLARALGTMEIDELNKYHTLARSQGTTDADELRALKQLADDNDTYDATKLKELREKQKEAQASPSQEQPEVSIDDLDRSREDLCDNEGGALSDSGSPEDSDDDNDFDGSVAESQHEVS